MNREEWTEGQCKLIEGMHRKAFEQGMVWGFILTLAAGVGISLAVLAATRWGHLFV